MEFLDANPNVILNAFSQPYDRVSVDQVEDLRAAFEGRIVFQDTPAAAAGAAAGRGSSRRPPTATTAVTRPNFTELPGSGSQKSVFNVFLAAAVLAAFVLF